MSQLLDSFPGTPDEVSFDVTVRVNRGALAATVAGELDVATAPILRRAIVEHGGHDQPIVYDLAELTFIDCTGLRALLGTDEGAAHNGHISIRNPSRSVVQLLHVLKLDDLLGS